MADNFVADAGSGGKTFGSDQIGGVDFPRSKLIHGADGTNDGDVSKANPLPVGTNTVKDGSGTNQAFLADSDGNLQVDVVASGLPTGAATAANQTTGNGSLSTIAGAVSGSEMQVDVVAALPAGTNAIGKLAANSGVDIGDVDVTSLANGSINGPGAPSIDSITQAAISSVTGANQQLVAAPGASKQIWVYAINFTMSTAGTVAFQDEDDTAITGAMGIADTGGMTMGPSGNFAMPIWKVATNKALEVDVVTGTINGSITYAIVSV